MARAPWWCVLLALIGCAPPPEVDWDAQVERGVRYVPRLSEPTWVVPSRGLPAEARPVFGSNNNLALAIHRDPSSGERLFLAWRTAPDHFASTQVRLHVVSSPLSASPPQWRYEGSQVLGADVREPRWLTLEGQLWLYWFEGGTDPLAFEPRQQWRAHWLGPGRFADRERWGEAKEISWDLKLRGGRALRTSYVGNHYQLDGPSAIEVRFTGSADGVHWEPLSGDGTVYRGGVSEVAFELDAQGDLWAVTRNEDGDATGFGSHLCTASAADLGRWECPARSDPERYDSPAMFRHGDDLYLVARRDVGGPFDQGRADLPWGERKRKYLADYWVRPKRTALYQIDREERRVRWLTDLPSAGDTAFPSVVRLGPHRFLVGNYTSPLSDPDRSWFEGQTSGDGTSIYLLELEFRAQ